MAWHTDAAKILYVMRTAFDEGEDMIGLPEDLALSLASAPPERHHHLDDRSSSRSLVVHLLYEVPLVVDPTSDAVDEERIHAADAADPLITIVDGLADRLRIALD